jgi:F-type H+-transporting ATPase subunit b
MADAPSTETVTHAPTVEQAAGHDAATLGNHTETTAAHGSGGLPQFEMQHWAGQIAYLLVLFAILYVLMSKVFAPRIRRIFDEREATISGALASAKQVQAEAAAQADEAQRGLADARSKAQRTATEAKSKADAEAKARQADAEAALNAKMAEAEAGIRASRDAALAHVGEVATDTAQAIVEKLTGEAAPREQVEAALAEARR